MSEHISKAEQAAMMTAAMCARVARMMDEDQGPGFSKKNPLVVATLTQAAIALQIHEENERRHTDLLVTLQRLGG